MAKRLLQSLDRPVWFEWFDLRIGLNNVSDATSAVVDEYFPRLRPKVVLNGEPPYYKYPLMRSLFQITPIETPLTMWFDDDSWILESAPKDFFGQIAAEAYETDMLGARYYWPHLSQQEREFIEDQPWYTGKPIPKSVEFITGGWWTIGTPILKKHSWPIAELQHDGGDVMLGVLCHQQGYSLGKWTEHIAINADDQGRCSKAPRRGVSGKTPRCGSNYQRGQQQPPPSDDWMKILKGD
jgi:hypothetical protein